MIRLSLPKIAAKIHWLREQGEACADKLLATPRYVESLCFLEAMSHLPGGLEKFCEGFIKSHRVWIDGLPKWASSYNTCENWPQSGAGMKPIDFAQWLHEWCEAQNVQFMGDVCFEKFDSRFPGFLQELSREMDNYAAAQIQKTADTALRRKAFLELDCARRSVPPIPLPIVADTRQGKTTAVETYCKAWPGATRRVEASESSSDRDFFGAFADAFNISWGPGTSRDQIKDQVQYVIRQIKPFLLIDEAHRLIPASYKKNTPPKRLNWVRSQIIDRHVPCAFFATPQSDREMMQRFIETTHANMEQWLGRMPKPVDLTTEPSYKDLMAVAAKLFPEFPQRIRQLLCDFADMGIGRGESERARITGERGFKIIEQAGARARFQAESRRREVTLEDIREGAEWAGVSLPAKKEPLPVGVSKRDVKILAVAGALPNRGGGSADLVPVLRGGRALTPAEPTIVDT